MMRPIAVPPRRDAVVVLSAARDLHHPIAPGVLCVAAAVLAFVVSACGTSGRDDSAGQLSAQDSAATAREVRSSLAGEMAPGAQAYSYRGLYAGLSRSRLEDHALGLRSGQQPACTPSGKQNDELSCAYDAVLGPDKAPVHVDVVYAVEGVPTGRIAREVAVTRELPLDVDGVRVARQLADAFEKQTALLDRRDAAYGHHQARVQMGTVNGARLNYVDVTVAPRTGREVLTVKMSRSAPARPSPATPKSPAPRKKA
jgi:hypothetical protein